MPWQQPAVTTYLQNNHTVRTETWRYTHYSDGGEELYDETKDPYEWTNLARNGGGDKAMKSELSKFLPQENKPSARSPEDATRSGGKRRTRGSDE